MIIFVLAWSSNGAEEENTSRKIIIENQLEITDHSHLGQLITYAAGLEAEFVIWVVREAREEHRQAVDWLNEHTDEHINFFLVSIELWQIESSPLAPRFTAISRPNEWKRSIESDVELTDTRARQLQFWQGLKEHSTTHHTDLKLRTPRAQHWYNIAIGRADCHVSLIVDSQQDQIRCELYIPDSKELFQTFLSNKARIEAELQVPEPLEWQELPGKKASRIRISRGFSFADEPKWQDAFDWLLNSARKFKRVFSKKWTPVGDREPEAS